MDFFALRSLKLPYHFCIRLKSGSTHEPSELGIEAKFTFVYDVAPPFMGFLLILDTKMKLDLDINYLTRHICRYFVLDEAFKKR